MQKLNNK